MSDTYAEQSTLQADLSVTLMQRARTLVKVDWKTGRTAIAEGSALRTVEKEQKDMD